MSDAKTHQHDPQSREHDRGHKNHHGDHHDSARHGHDHHHHRHHRRRWFNITAEQRDVIIMILGGVIALVFVLLFIF